MMVMKYLILKAWLITIIDQSMVLWTNTHRLKVRNVSSKNSNNGTWRALEIISEPEDIGEQTLQIEKNGKH